MNAENSIHDNPPGEENLTQEGFLGNYVVIDHENGEYSLLFHFQQGSVAVHPGERVAMGQFLGLCGNSGASDMPHLHYHLQATPDPLGFDAEGLPIQFRSYRANGLAFCDELVGFVWEELPEPSKNLNKRHELEHLLQCLDSDREYFMDSSEWDANLPAFKEYPLGMFTEL